MEFKIIMFDSDMQGLNNINHSNGCLAVVTLPSDPKVAESNRVVHH